MMLLQPEFTGRFDTSKTTILASAEIIGKDRKRYFLSTGSSNGGMSSVTIDTPRVFDEFERQEAAFMKIPPLLLSQYSGNWVASINGEIVDSDKNLAVLTNRFFENHGDAPVFMTQIGEPPFSIRSPFLR